MTVKAERKLTTQKAIAEAIASELKADDSVLVMGEDIGVYGDIFGATEGLLDEFGPGRVMDTPISETGFIGAAVGAAINGLRPIVELMFVDFFGVCFDQVLNNAAKFRYMYGSHAATPITIRTTYGAFNGTAGQHSGVLYPIFTHLPGIKVAIPSNPYDAKGLLIQAIRDDDPVIFFEHKVMYDDEEEVPDEPYTIPFGEANLTREGADVTIVAIGRMVGFANQAADALEAEGITCNVVDPRATSPLDHETILECVAETGRLVVVDESSPRCNMASDISALVSERAFGALKAPILRVTPPHTPVPFAPELEDAYVPSPDKIAAAVRQVLV